MNNKINRTTMDEQPLLPRPTFLTHQDFVDLRKSIQSLDSPRFDAAVLSKGTEIAAFYLKDGCADFLAFSRRMIADVGECIRPYLKSLYSAVRYCPGMERYVKDMSPVDFVHLVDVQMIDIKRNGEERLFHTAKVAVSIIEAGNVSIFDFATEMIDKLGDDIRPYITAAYETVKHWLVINRKIDLWKEMDSDDVVDEFNADSFDNEPDLEEEDEDDNIATRDEMKAEAISRMKAISLDSDIIDDFQESDTPQVYEPPYGASYYLEDEELEGIHELEFRCDILVWGVIRCTMKYNREDVTVDCMLYVSNNKADWEDERNDLYNGIPHVFTSMKEYPVKDSGHINIYLSDGGTPLRR